MNNFFNKKFSYSVAALFFLGIFLRIFNLSWGSPYFFHPDERNVASLIASPIPNTIFAFASQGTFSYGNFVSLFLQLVRTLLSLALPNIDTFTLSTMLVRYNSVLFSSLTLLVLFFLGLKFSKRTGFLTLMLSALSVGFIQNAHFGTYDTFITFWIILSFYFCVRLLMEKKIIFFYLAVLAVTIASAAKITSLVFLVIVYLSLARYIKYSGKKIKTFLLSILLSVPICSLCLVLSPYYFTKDFFGLLQYERDVVSGQLDVFYTQSFRNTTPLIYQLTSIFPFLLNPIIAFIAPLSVLYSLIMGIKKKDFIVLLAVLSLLIVFTPQAVLYAKWSRYMLPSLPFLYLLTALMINNLLSKIGKKHIKKATLGTYAILLLSSLLFAYAYFSEVLIQNGRPEEAAQWASKNINANSQILSETADLGITPFNSHFHNIVLFDFYSLDAEEDATSKLNAHINESQYYILPSQRVLKGRISNPSSFPKGNIFYKSVLTNNNKFKKVYETPCNIFCKLLYGGSPIFGTEETISVFDRPTVLIYKIIH